MDNQSLSQQPYLTFFDEGTAEYDVIVDQSSSAPNLKEATWGALQPLMPLIADRIGPEEFALILEYSPLPESFLEKFQGIMDEKAQQPPPPDPEMMKIEALKQGKQAELQMKQQETQVQMQMDQQKTQADLTLEQQKTAAQIQLEREKAQAQLDLERAKAQANFELERQRMQMDQQRFSMEQQRAQSDTALKHKAMKHELVLKTGLAKVGMKKQNSEADGAEMDDSEDDLDLFGNKAVSDAIAQLAQAMTQMAQANAESQRMMAQGIAQLGSELRDAMTKPKQIVRGPDGRAVGVQ